MRDRTEPNTPAVAPPPEAPPRRKSSWESLANMFNIKVDRSKPAEVAQEVERPAPEPVQPRGSRPADDAGTDDDQPFAIFSEQRPSRSNPALDAMFGDAPAPSKSSHDDWGKPRVIDDLGWDNDDRKRSSQRDDSSSSSAAQDEPSQGRASSGAASSEPASDGDDDDAPRRGRRRRRGRRGRSDSAGSSTDTSPVAESSRSWGGLDGGDTDSDTADESDHGLHDDPWDEPESFELIHPGKPGEQEPDSDDDSDELSADGEVLRRSSRRRRRGPCAPGSATRRSPVSAPA